MVKGRESLREICSIFAGPSQLQLLHSCVVSRGEGVGDGGDNWEVLKKKKGIRKKERKHKQLWFAVTHPQASCAIFNTQARVLFNLFLA